MTLHQLADALMEIHRYVQLHPDHVKKQINDLGAKHDVGIGNGDLRLYRNIHVGLRFIHCDPEILEGYLYNAAFEIRCEARKQEKELEEGS